MGFRSLLRPPAVLGALAGVALLAPIPRPSCAAPKVHAIVNARIVTAPGHVIERGTVVMRDGVITAVGANVAIPADARVWPGDSLTVYPGMIEPFALAPESEPTGGARGTGHSITGVRPEYRVLETLATSDSGAALRSAGFAIAHYVPRRGIVRGSSVIAGLSTGGPHGSVIEGDAAQVMSLDTNTGVGPAGYPSSLMGSIALIRQTLADAQWNRDAWAAYRKKTGVSRPAANVSLEALEAAAAGRAPVFLVADGMLEVLQAAALAQETGVRACVVGNGDEYKRVSTIAKSKVSLVVPVRFPEAPIAEGPDDALEIPIEDLRFWNEAPGNASALSRAGVPFAFSTWRLKDPKNFRAAVARAIERGLSRDAALAAVTTGPAKLLGIEARAGTIAPGKAAHLTVTRGGLFDEGSKVVEVWVDGERLPVPSAKTTVAGTWTLTLPPGGRRTLIVSGDADTSVRLVAGSDTVRATAIRLEPQRVAFTAALPGGTRTFDLFLHDERLLPRDSSGTIALRVSDEKPSRTAKQDRVVTPAVAGNTEPWRMPEPEQTRTLIIQDATVWTAGPKGTLEHADVIVKGGKISAVGTKLAVPSGAVVIDGTGKHVAPGIIDAHSHSAIVGGVNECTNSVTAEVRIADVINSESIEIYRQLAGGTTMMHLLHGSCNAIGGQCAVIKNRWGQPAQGLRFDAAPPTIKFALGENPKRSNFDAPGARDRYPQSRAGVEQVIREAFTAARDYESGMDEWKRGKRPLPPRRDYQKETVLEILNGRRLIHSHSYRQDEILMLMRLAKEFGVTVQTFQHVLEGYKVADEMAAHGASASAFSDWWAYKYEVIDAIPQNGYLMWDRGVNVSYNSDSNDLARRLNTEAAKAVKFGGVPPDQAIQFVTLNPAKQLRIDNRVGSLEPGKDADFSIWSGSPLSPYSLCEQTWIEGRKYFDRAADLEGREALVREREALVARARLEKKTGAGNGEKMPAWNYLDDHEHGCAEGEDGE